MKKHRLPVELASDIGAKAFDLREVAAVTPEMLAWLRDRLLDITQQPSFPKRPQAAGAVDPQAAGSGTPTTRVTASDLHAVELGAGREG